MLGFPQRPRGPATSTRVRPWQSRPSLRLPLAILTCLATTAISAQSFAQSPQQTLVNEAEDYAAKAFTAYNRKDYPAAVTLYLKAYDALPSAVIIFNIARIYDSGIRDRLLAIQFYRRYISDPDAEPERIRAANQRIIELRSAEQAAEPSLATEQAASGSDAAPIAARPTAMKAPASGWSALQITGTASAVLGLAAIGVGSGFALSAMGDQEEAKPLCEEGLCRTEEGVELSKDALRKARWATIGFAGGGVLIATGVTLWLLDSGSSSGEEAYAGIRWTPVASASEIGAVAQGWW